MKKAAGFYVVLVSAVLALVSVFLYSGAMITVSNTRIMLIISVIVAALALALAGKLSPAITGWAGPICAVLTGLGIFFSVNVMADPIGYVISGLYVFSDIQGYIIFMVVAIIAMILDIVAGFMTFTKAE